MMNPYDLCVANKIVDGKQMTILWHVNNVKASHKDPRKIDNFIKWVKDTYRKIGKAKVI